MNGFTRHMLAVLLMLVPHLTGYCQDDRVVRTSHHQQPFTEFVTAMEASFPVHFYFRQEWIDSVRIIQHEEEQKLTEILDATLSPHQISFYIREGNIFLSSGRVIDPSLARSFPEKEPVAGYPEKASQTELTDEDTGQKNGDYNHIIRIGTEGSDPGDQRATINGTVREAETGEPIIGAVVYNEDQQLGVITDASGYYVISLGKGTHRISFRSLGKEEVSRNVILKGDGSLNVEMEEKVTQLKGVEIVADKYQNVSGMQIGLNRIEVSTINTVPAAMGETDIFKAALLLPGVQTVGEGASGFNVRGGSTDQNLIIFNGAPVFNTSHLFGFFSAFNPDVIKEFKLYKSGIGAEYGGRISSVFDITTRNGNRKNLSGAGGVSPVTGRLMLEGPIIKEKLSFILGARSTYSDWILKQIKDPAIRNSSAAFYDLNGKISMDLDENNSLEISGYYSNDYFRLNSDTAYRYDNTNLVVAWKHLFSERLMADFSGNYSSYHYHISSDSDELQAFDMKYGIVYSEVKGSFSYFPAFKHRVKFGAGLIRYQLEPGYFGPMHHNSLVSPADLENERALEGSLYLSDEYHLTSDLSLYAGIRYSFYAFMGPKTVFKYYRDVPKDHTSLYDTVRYDRGECIQTYSGPELRLNVRYKLTGSSSVKLSYNRMRQYLNMLSNTTAISPTDTWKLSDPNIRPQVGDQLALGFYKDFRGQRVETSIEIYYKRIKDIIEYRGGARLILNEVIEQDLIHGRGRAYGTELMVKRTAGKLNGWISYTYSRILVQADSDFPVERINNGEWFPANHDKPHDITLVGKYRFSRRFSVSSNVTYSTGRPITYPVAKYRIRNKTVLHYTSRNEYRIPDYFRWDLSVNVEGNLRSKKLAHSSWSFSLYNVTGRNNVYSIYFVSDDKDVSGYRLSIFSRPVFTVTYNFKF